MGVYNFGGIIVINQYLKYFNHYFFLCMVILEVWERNVLDARLKT